MEIPLYEVNAFGKGPYTGNPAAVMLPGHWLPDNVLQAIAEQNNLAETAFVVNNGGKWQIRWFTPKVEVNLCGHATLAAGWILFENGLAIGDSVCFDSQSGKLTVGTQADGLSIDFPVDNLTPISSNGRFDQLFGFAPREVLEGKTDLMMVFESQETIQSIEPVLPEIARLTQWRGVIVTAPGEHCDFVSRFFAPQSGINEDPVTGSAHTSLAAYWQSRTGKSVFKARQLSARGGWLRCQVSGKRVIISGKVELYVKGTANVSVNLKNE